MMVSLSWKLRLLLQPTSLSKLLSCPFLTDSTTTLGDFTHYISPIFSLLPGQIWASPSQHFLYPAVFPVISPPFFIFSFYEFFLFWDFYSFDLLFIHFCSHSWDMENSSAYGHRFRRIPRHVWAANTKVDPLVSSLRHSALMHTVIFCYFPGCLV